MSANALPSRRDFLRLACFAGGTLGLASVLAACGSSSTSSVPASVAAKSSIPSTTPVSSAVAPSSAAGSSSSSQPASAGAKAAAGTTFKIAYVAPVAANAPLWMAEAVHAFADNHVNVEARLLEASAASAALVANEIDAIQTAAPAMLSADLNGHLDMVIVASLLNHGILAMYTDPSIKSAADLKGKIVASDRPGTPVDYATHTALSLLGLKPSDVQLLPVGGGEPAYAALLSGQAKATMLVPPQSFGAEAKGFHMLQDTFHEPYQNIALTMRKSRLDGLAQVVPGVLAGLKKGVQAYNTQPDLAIKVLQQYTQESDQTILKKTYEFDRSTVPFETSLQPTLEGIKGMLDFLSASIPAAKDAKPEEFVDTRFLAQLPKE